MLWAPTIANALTIMPMGWLEATLQPFLAESPFELSVGVIGTLMSVGSLGFAIAAIATSFAQNYVGQLTQISAGQLLMASGSLLIATSTSSALTTIAYILLCLGTGLALVVSASLMSRTQARSTRTRLKPRVYPLRIPMSDPTSRV